jgi:hypothetical protein
MNIEHVHEGIRYTLTNDGLQQGDKVYPIAWGRCLDGGGWIFMNWISNHIYLVFLTNLTQL